MPLNLLNSTPFFENVNNNNKSGERNPHTNINFVLIEFILEIDIVYFRKIQLKHKISVCARHFVLLIIIVYIFFKNGLTLNWGYNLIDSENTTYIV